ncbi:MAG: type II toxin-antitoxin system RelE family toxin [Planctomycetota bacterium]
MQFAPSAAREFRKLERGVQQRLKPKIDSLAQDPRPRGAEKLSGGGELCRIRVGAHRVVYAVRDRELIVLVVRVGHCGDVYRRR